MAYEYQSFATLGVNLNRQNYGALDISQVFTSQADLNYYISKGAITTGVSSYWYDATDAENIKKVVPYPYAGQYLALVDNATREVTAYILVEKADGTFETKEVGKAPIGDGKSIEVDAAGVISLKGFGGLTEAQDDYLPRVKWVEAEGDVAAHAEIEWVPVSAVVEGDGNKVTTLTSEDGTVKIEVKTNTDESLVYDLSVEHPDIPEYAIEQVEAMEGDIYYSYRLTKDGERAGVGFSVPTMEYIDGLRDNKADKATTLAGYGITDAYTKEEVNGKLADKADKTTLVDYYTKTQADAKFADKAETLAGYGITDAYTKTEVDGKLDLKANAADVYTKEAADEAIATAVAAADHLKRMVVTKEELDAIAETGKIVDAEGKEQEIEVTQYVFLVPAAEGEDSENDNYDEYMIIDGKIERLGSWQVDLANYVTTSNLTETLKSYVTSSALATTLADYVTNTALGTTLNNYPTRDEFQGFQDEITNNYATSTEVGNLINGVEISLGQYIAGVEMGMAEQFEAVNASLETKADADKVYTKDEVNGLNKALQDNIDLKADKSDTYTKKQVDDALSFKANELETFEAINKKADADKVYTKDEIDDIVGEAGVPAVKDEDGNVTSEAIPGSGIYENVYSKAEITDLIEGVTGGESAAAVKAALTQYQTTNDAAVKAIGDRVGAVEEHVKDVEAGAQVNIIDTVASEFAVEGKELQLVSVPVGKLNGLDAEELAITKVGEETEGKLRIVAVSATKLTDLNTDELAITDSKLGIKAVSMSKVTGLNDRLTGLDNKFNDYVTKATYSAEFGTHANLKNISGKEAHTAIDEINALIDALTWVDMQ